MISTTSFVEKFIEIPVIFSSGAASASVTTLVMG